MSKPLFDRPLPPGYRDELGALIAAPPPEPPRKTGTILLFQIGHLRLALPARVTAAIAPVLHIARIPHRFGTVLLGLAAHRGDIVPCCSLARLLDVEHQQTGAPRTLILEEAAGRLWAIPVDAVLGVRDTVGEPRGDTGGDSNGLAPHWIKRSFVHEAESFHLLDEDILFRQITLATA